MAYIAILSPSFLFGVVVLFYLLFFVLFAVIRIATGVSIQRVGYLSLRRIAYTPREGIRIEVRGLGLHLHRPTFARPTWISLRLTDLKVTVDYKSLLRGKYTRSDRNAKTASHAASPRASTHNGHPHRGSSDDPPRSQTWRRLTQAKNKIKALHGKINWLRLIDVEALNSSCVMIDVGVLQVASLSMAVDTRRRTVDRGRLFRHKKVPLREQQPAEWMFVLKSVLFTADGKDSLEILDICSLNVHGLLYKNLAGLRDASISLKLGRIHVPYDDFVSCQMRFRSWESLYGNHQSSWNRKEVTFTDMMEEFRVPGSREEKIVRTVSDSKEFISSLLRGIQEIQLAVSFIGLSKEVRTVLPSGQPLFINFAMNEFGIDLFRLDPKSPAHRMYFPPNEIAHQALFAAISIGVSVDDGSGKPERLLYVPMATTTIKTTLPSKTIADTSDRNAAERNANMLLANLVVTSPSVDLDLKHMPIVLALFHGHSHRQASPGPANRNRLISRLLPKANVKISIQEPVARLVLPPSTVESTDTEDYELLISSISSISLDLESSHSSAGDLHYALTANLRVSAYHFYYQAANGERHNILLLDALDLKIQVSATPEVSVIVTGNIESFSGHMIRSEISKGVHQVIQQLNRNVSSDGSAQEPPKSRASLLRRLPSWLVSAQFKGSNFGIEVSGTDPDVSGDMRGVALQLQSWGADYKVQRYTRLQRRKRLHRTASDRTSGDENTFPTPASPTRRTYDTSDGRRLGIHIQGFEGFVVEGRAWEHEPFLSVPRFDATMSTSSDSQGFVFHVSSHMKALYLQYSLYRYYAIGVAYTVVKRAFSQRHPARKTAIVADDPRRTNMGIAASLQDPDPVDSTTTDVKIMFLQVKATLPSDPSMMLQVHGLEGGHQRWAAPFLRSRLFRIYVEPQKIRSAWARLVSVGHVRIDLRTNRKKSGDEYVSEKSIDVSTEFARLAVPHQLVLHKVFDNFVNVVKATEQLHHRFGTGTNEYVLQKRPEDPKRVPRISLRARTLIFELEDGSFDWKLELIYRVGLNEQKQRLAREEAFRVKVKKLEEQSQRRDSSRYRPHYPQHKDRGRSKSSYLGARTEQNRSTEARPRRDSSTPDESRGRHMRYDAEAVSGLTGTAKISAQDAWLKLQEHNAQSWRKRIAFAIKYQSSAMKDIRSTVWGNDEFPEDAEEPEKILSVPGRPGLVSALINDLHVVIDKPSFPIHDYAKFLHSVGKGMPFGMEYSLLIPMNIQISLGEARVTLRNYPLPLIHVPGIKAGQSSRLPSLSLKTDFVIAEEYRDEQSLKHVRVEVVPQCKIDSSSKAVKGFGIDVRRTVSPVKTYSDVDIAINTSNPTTITWGTSYQPAIQDMMQIIENFTKPQIDPSDRAGFWDKIRLILHSRVRVAWKGDGDVHLRLKGSRDPYTVTGHGAGFVMCFRNRVRWDIHQDDDPKKFMTVSCGEYVLAIPDYSYQARQSSRGSGRDTESMSSNRNHQQNAMFKKVVMKLSGNVRWLAGLVFERDLEQGGRSFDFIPHYKVALKTPSHAKAIDNLVSQCDTDYYRALRSLTVMQPYDAFRGFCSQYIHLSIAVIAPIDRDWSVSNVKPSISYNSMHMSPRFFTHFFDWWSLFSGVMSLPIRQGRLFPGVEKSSKKFGRHLATIKYNLMLSPFFISHVYKHKDVEDYTEDTVGATGLKLRIDSFMLDLHQRREEFATQGNGRLKMTRTSGMRINKAQLDFISADMRAVSASIAGTSPDDLKRATDDDIASYHDQIFVSPDISRFTIPDHDLLWIDMDDFVELDWILPAETHPKTKIMPLAFAPRFTYFRQTDHEGVVSGDVGRTSHFGDEPTHFCIMSQDNDPQRVQRDLIRERLLVLKAQLEDHRRAQGEQELRVVRDGHGDSRIREQYDLLKQQCRTLEEKIAFTQSMLTLITERLKSGIASRVSESNGTGELGPGSALHGRPITGGDEMGPEASPTVDPVSDFNNRFIVHNIQLKWNNSLRNIILRYVHQVSQRRGFVYYMSRRAVKFILDIIEEQQRNKEAMNAKSHHHTPTGQPSPSMSFKEDGSDISLEERIRELLNDGKNFVDANDPEPSERSPKHAFGTIGQNISDEFTAQDSYHVRLIAPQIQLQSEKNARSVLLVTAEGMHLKVIQIMDKSRLADDVSGLVQRRFSVDMDGVQFFVTNQQIFNKFLHLYSANKYGSPKGAAWPPWTPLEVNYDFQLNPSGWFRVVQKTSASLRYDKFNTLRLKYNDELNKTDASERNVLDDAESRIDHLWVEFPHIRAICDSSQYYTMYVIVLDLLLYSEPLEKIRSERLEKIMLAADFSDLSGTPEMVISLQERIHQLEEIKEQFQLHAKYLDRQGWQDRLAIERDLASCEDELFFMMKAITTSQRKYDDRSPDAQSNGLLRWYLSASEIVWHLMREKNEPLMEIQLQHAAYDRTDNSDGSNHNTMEIGRIHGLNLLPDALYPEMIAPFFENSQSFADQGHEDIKMFKVHWYMLEAIAGIPVLDQFEVNLFPLKVQLEREVGKKLFEYIFPGNAESGGASPFLVKHMPPVKDEDEDETLENASNMHLTPHSSVSDIRESHSVTRPGSLELRLRPTLTLSDTRPVTPSSLGKSRASEPNGETNRFKLFSSQNKLQLSSRSQQSVNTLPNRSTSRKSSRESLQSIARLAADGSVPNISTVSINSERSRIFGMHRTVSKDGNAEKEKPSDDLTEMMSRASNYMTLAYVKIPSVVLCLSYKGRGERNIEDVHDFVFRMPALEYRNKTWSNLDLALRLKKDVIKALISHTGAIIGNKFSHHRPTKHQQSRLREIANSSSLLPNTNSVNNMVARTATTIHHRSSSRDRPEDLPPSTFIAGWGTQVARDHSEAPSLDDILISPRNRMATPTTSQDPVQESSPESSSFGSNTDDSEPKEERSYSNSLNNLPGKHDQYVQSRDRSSTLRVMAHRKDGGDLQDRSRKSTIIQKILHKN